MTQNYLLLDEQYPIPKEIEVLNDWGTLAIIVNDDEKDQVIGTHVLLKGELKDFSNWMGKFDGVWVGVGNSPQMERFSIMSIKEELIDENK